MGPYGRGGRVEWSRTRRGPEVCDSESPRVQNDLGKGPVLRSLKGRSRHLILLVQSECPLTWYCMYFVEHHECFQLLKVELSRRISCKTD